jgi:hypothetical protein
MLKAIYQIAIPMQVGGLSSANCEVEDFFSQSLKEQIPQLKPSFVHPFLLRSHDHSLVLPEISQNYFLHHPNFHLTPQHHPAHRQNIEQF